MEERNKTRNTVIHLLGFHPPHTIIFLVFLIFLLIYCVTLCGNLLIITLVSYSKSLHSPMYFFLSQLSLSDIILATDILPNTLHAILVENASVISISACIAQINFFIVSEASECLLLTLMSYDRYLAICKPLHYTTLMSHQFCWTTIISSWSLSFLPGFIYNLLISELQFCSSNVVDNFFCEIDTILNLSCSNISLVQLITTLFTIIFGIFPFVVIFVSYVYIIVTIFNMSSISGRQKAMSTCSSHLTVVSIYYGTGFCVYLAPRNGQSLTRTKFLSLLYTVVNPLMNPIIYSLRNEDLKEVVGRYTKNLLKFSFIIKLTELDMKDIL